MTHPFMADIANGSRRARHRHVALSVSLYGAGLEAAGYAKGCPRHRSRRRRRQHRGSFLSLPLFAGGKSFGGRMTSQAQAISPLPGVRGLAFVGFPLASGREAVGRARSTPVRREGSDAVHFKERVTSLRICDCCNRSSDGSARGRHSCRSRTPITRSTCPRAPDARIRISGVTWRMRWPTGST